MPEDGPFSSAVERAAAAALANPSEANRQAVEDAWREHRFHAATESIRRIVDAAPALTADQIARLRDLLPAPAGD